MYPVDDSALLRDYCDNHSNEAFAELVGRHVNLVYSVAIRHVANPHHAEEITQAVFIILARKAASLRHDKALGSWLFQTTHLTANNFIRSEMRRHHREQEAYMRSTPTESDAGVWKEISPLLDTAVARLSEKDRRAIVLRFYEGRDLGEVGAALGANEAAAKKRISRALEKLRTVFAKRGVDSTAATIGDTISANSIQIAPAALAKSVTAVAIAKGSIATASTLTLVKGTLNLMTWTKLKFALGIASAMLLVGGTVTVALSQNSQSPVPPALNGAPSQQGQGISILINSRFYAVPDKSLDSLKIPWRTKSGATMALLSREQVNTLRAGLTNINGLTPLGTPRVITTSGAASTMSVTEPVTVNGTNAQTGITLNVTPSVSGDLFDLKLAVEWTELPSASQPLLTTRAAAAVQLAKGQSVLLRQEIEPSTQTGDTPPRSLVVLVMPTLSATRLTRLTKLGPGNGRQVMRTFQGSNAVTRTNNFSSP